MRIALACLVLAQCARSTHHAVATRPPVRGAGWHGIAGPVVSARRDPVLATAGTTFFALGADASPGAARGGVDSVSLFDSVRGKWTAAERAPFGGHAANPAAVATPQGVVVVGVSCRDISHPDDCPPAPIVAAIYDVAHDSWKKLQPPPGPAYNAAELDGGVYAVGAYMGKAVFTLTQLGAGALVHSALISYDPRSRAWATLGRPLVSSTAVNACTDGTHLIAFGSPGPMVSVFDRATSSWSVATHPEPTLTTNDGTFTFACDPDGVLAFGETGARAPFGVAVTRFDWAKPAWVDVVAPPAPQSLALATSSVWTGSALLLWPDNVHEQSLLYDPVVADPWSVVAAGPLVSVVVGGKTGALAFASGERASRRWYFRESGGGV